MHGSKESPSWFLWVHLFMNLFMIIPFGCILESKMGSKNTLIVVLSAIIFSSITFQILLSGKDEMATGISVVGYAFVAGGTLNLIQSWTTYSKKFKNVCIILCVLDVLMLFPMMTGWVSTCLHISGIVSYFFVYFIMKLLAHLKK